MFNQVKKLLKQVGANIIALRLCSKCGVKREEGERRGMGKNVIWNIQLPTKT